MEAAEKGGNPEDCPVCMIAYDDTVQRPRTLPCGHTVCTLCINKLNDHGHVTCPECRVSHTVPVEGEFPISYTVEAFIRRMKNIEAAVASSSPHSAGNGIRAARAASQKAAGLSKKMLSFLQEQEATVVAAITTCKEVQSQLDQYQGILTDWGEQQQQLQDRLQELVAQSISAKELVQQEKSRAASKKEEVRKGEQQLHVALETVRTVTTEQEAGMAVSEAFRCTDETEQVVEECCGSFPDEDTVITVRKVREVSNAALEAVNDVQVALETHPSVTTEEVMPQADPELMSQSDQGLVPQSDPELMLESDPELRLLSHGDLRPQTHPSSTIMDRLWAIVPPSLKSEDLLRMTQPAKILLEAGRVFAVHQVEGQCQHASISLEADRVYLHALKEQPPPPGSVILQVNEIVPPSPPCIVFLDLSWPGITPQRVLIYLSRDTPLGQQFVLLCTGQRGPSYANTRFFRVGGKGQPGERVWGGDYESEDGKGGATLLPDLAVGEYWESGRAGVVGGRRGGDPARGAQFAITTMDRKGGGEYVLVFGEVVQGLDTVVAAAQQSNIQDVNVVDCGVVLSKEWSDLPAPSPTSTPLQQ